MAGGRVIVVVGGGTMGAGIAACFLASGESATVVERSDSAAGEAYRNVADCLDRLADADMALDARSALAGLETRADHAPVGASLVVEAVPEDIGLKKALLAEVEPVYGRDAVLASNTSSLSITEMSESLEKPDRFLGMHFFNPATRMELVEIAVGERTSPAAVDACRGWAERLGKTPITVRDSPGFASSRLGLALGLEAIRMVEAGVASAEDIDTAMALGYRHPMGPLKLTDLVGLDVRQAVAEHLAAELGSRFEPPGLLRSMVREGRLGKKTGRGFYRW